MTKKAKFAIAVRSLSLAGVLLAVGCQPSVEEGASSAPAAPALPESIVEPVVPRGADAMVVGRFEGSWDAASGQLRIRSVADAGIARALDACGLTVASDGQVGTNPPNTIELYTEAGSLAGGGDCAPAPELYSEYDTVRALCGSVVIRNFYGRPLARVWAQIDTMEPVGAAGYSVASPPAYDLGGALSGGFGRWSYGTLDAAGGPGAVANVPWVLSTSAGVDQFTFTGQVLAFEDEVCDGVDNDCDGAIDEGACPPPAPGGVVASEGTSADHVVLSWDPVVDADEYVIWRDGSEVARVAGSPWLDSGADAGSYSADAAGFGATGQPTMIALTWSAPPPIPGTAHEYRVSTVREGLESSKSDPASGYRSAPAITGYIVTIDGTPMPVGLTGLLEDLGAPEPYVVPGSVDASDALHVDRVELSATGWSALPGSPVSYTLQVQAGAWTSGPSAPAVASRVPGALTYRWERTVTEVEAGGYNSITGELATSTHSDTGAPADGSARLYRVNVGCGAGVCVEYRSGPESGSRAVPVPTVNPLAATSITATTATLNAELTELGIPAAWDWQICWGRNPANLPDCETVTPVEVGLGSVTATGLRPGRTYFFRTLAVSDEGTFVNPTTLSFDTTGLAFGEACDTQQDCASGMCFSGKCTPRTPVFDGGLTSGIGVSGGYIVGGYFQNVGRYVGTLHAWDASTGARDIDFPTVDGTIFAVTRDDAGNWLIGGSFSRVGAHARAGFARLLPDGQVDTTFNIGTNGIVYRIVEVGGQYLIGGSFSTVGGTSRTNLARINVDGTLDGVNYAVNGAVQDIDFDGTTILIVGGFTSVLGESRSYVAELALDNTLLPFAPVPDGGVSAVARWKDDDENAHVAIGGTFGSVDGQSSPKLALIEVGSGIPATLGAHPDNGSVTAIVAGPDGLRIGGTFSTVGGQPRNAIARYGTDFALDSWSPNVELSFVHDFATIDGDVLIAGSFGVANGQPRVGVVRVDAEDASILSFDTDLLRGPGGGAIRALWVADGRIVGGGNLSGHGRVARSRLARFSSAGALQSWSVPVNGHVSAMTADGTNLYFGGGFTEVDGTSRTRLAAVSLSTGALLSWAPTSNGDVTALLVDGTRVWIGGYFGQINGTNRSGMAIVSTAGVLNSANPSPSMVNGFSKSGTSIYVFGVFNSISGQARPSLARFSTTGMFQSEFNANLVAGGPVSGAISDGTWLYIVGNMDVTGWSGYGKILRVDPTTGALDSTFKPVYSSFNFFPDTLLVEGETVRVGGQLQTVNGSGVTNAVAVEKTTGSITSWAPLAGHTRFILPVTGGYLLGGSFSGAGAAQIVGAVPALP